MSDTRRHRLQKFGLDENDYEFLSDTQDGRCAICGVEPEESRRLAVDHCHRTHVVRGLLCTRCNMGLGFFDDDPARLQKAVEYLKQSLGWFTDCCPQCQDEDDYRAWPAEKLHGVDPGWLIAQYRCSSGHRWTCGWSPKVAVMGFV